MSQTKTMSAVESAAGTAIGFVISWALTPLILALFGYQAGAGTAFGIVAIYTALSFGRTWLVRRLFNWIHHRHDPKPEQGPIFDGRNGNGYQPVRWPKAWRPPPPKWAHHCSNCGETVANDDWRHYREGCRPVQPAKEGRSPAAALAAETSQRFQDVIESADVMAQWGNPCVREANQAWQRRRFFGPDPEFDEDLEWLANQRLSHNRRRNRP